ncbi:hypothetical protein GCK72_017339 [Caenorhabditis remanei]|uniref:Uncharacterized protein n=1 Tax=Caenorhabditis remanei TaxID=31234 RepID=A0A6A5G6U5_CAERE|nr:hypothetical protein GCK72_017339 [Caenorhabditis remanei]KAF1750788.1 hypothetical protein GCK72_017339 [Caenorhabditis remanei]
MAAGKPRSNIVPGRRYPGYAALWAAGGDISEFETYKNLTSGDLSGRSEKDSEEQVGPIGEIQPDDFVPIDFSDPDADFEDAVEDAIKEPDEETKEPDEETKEPDEETKEPDEETKEPDEEANEPDEEANEPDEEANEPDEEANEPDEEANEPDGEANEPDEEANEPDEEANEPDEEANEPDEDAVEAPVDDAVEAPVDDAVEAPVDDAVEETDEEAKKTKKHDEDDEDDEANALSDSESIAKNRPKRNRLPPLNHWVGERPIYKYEDGYAQLVGKTEAFCAESVKKAEKELEKMRNKIGRVKRNTNKYKVQKQMVDAIKAKHQKK